VFPEWIAPEQAAQLEAHFELLTRWNRTLNLTRIRDRAEAIERHYNESLFVARHLPSGPLRIADIGSGAGFPGFPLAVVRPEYSVTLIESHGRKAVFLSEASRKLPNIKVLAQRDSPARKIRRPDWASTGTRPSPSPIPRIVSCGSATAEFRKPDCFT
jgi:16S rRNA (guanine(527)-N(7))-methyltransferase RsmG